MAKERIRKGSQDNATLSSANASLQASVRKESTNPRLAITPETLTPETLNLSFKKLIERIETAADGKMLIACSVPMIEHFCVGNLYSDNAGIQKSMENANKSMTNMAKKFGMGVAEFPIEKEVNDLISLKKSGDDAGLKRMVDSVYDDFQSKFGDNYKPELKDNDRFYYYVKNAPSLSDRMNPVIPKSEEQVSGTVTKQESAGQKEAEAEKEGTETEKEETSEKGGKRGSNGTLKGVWEAILKGSDIERIAIGATTFVVGAVLTANPFTVFVGIPLEVAGVLLVVPSVAHLFFEGAKDEFKRMLKSD